MQKYDLSKDFQGRQDVEVQQHGFLYYTVYNELHQHCANSRPKKMGSMLIIIKTMFAIVMSSKPKVKMQNQGLVVKSTIDKIFMTQCN